MVEEAATQRLIRGKGRMKGSQFDFYPKSKSTFRHRALQLHSRTVDRSYERRTAESGADLSENALKKAPVVEHPPVGSRFDILESSYLFMVPFHRQHFLLPYKKIDGYLFGLDLHHCVSSSHLHHHTSIFARTMRIS